MITWTHEWMCRWFKIKYSRFVVAVSWNWTNLSTQYWGQLSIEFIIGSARMFLSLNFTAIDFFDGIASRLFWKTNLVVCLFTHIFNHKLSNSVDKASIGNQICKEKSSLTDCDHLNCVGATYFRKYTTNFKIKRYRSMSHL